MSRFKSSLRRDGFTFKRFFVAHDRCAMKVGTDSVLLGAWVPVVNVRRVLDIGTGSGLLALMLAQRTSGQAHIDAIEIDPAAAEQARENVQASSWNPCINVINEDVLAWSQRQTQRYDLIISNPPYFASGVRCATPARDRARSTLCLDHDNLLHCAAQLITEEGMLCLVLPQDTGATLADKAQAQGWHCRLRTDVQENHQRAPHRILLALSPTAGDNFCDKLVIRNTDNHYSDAYCSLTRDFYLFL